MRKYSPLKVRVNSVTEVFLLRIDKEGFAPMPETPLLESLA